MPQDPVKERVRVQIVSQQGLYRATGDLLYLQFNWLTHSYHNGAMECLPLWRGTPGSR